MAATDDTVLAFHEFPGGGDSARVRPLVSPDAVPHYEALASGRFVLQRCAACSRFRVPPGPVCPYCGSDASRWDAVSTRGIVHSWTRYHRAFLPEFEPLVPYAVLNVLLEDGPRLIGRWLGKGEVRTGMAVRVVVERWRDGLCVPAFTNGRGA